MQNASWILWINFGLAGAAQEEGERWRFVEIGEDCGVDFRHRYGGDAFRCIVEDTGSGVALFDCDGDGRLDVYLVNGGLLPELHGSEASAAGRVSNRLYRNEGSFRFRDITKESGTGDEGYGMGVAVGDYDNDGDEDLYVLNYGPNVLLRNEGEARFRDKTSELGLAGPETLAGASKWSVNAVFFDYDLDGDLDLYVSNDLAFDPAVEAQAGERYPGPDAYRAQPSMLYRNDGERFVDVSAQLGFDAVAQKSMGASVADFDADGSPDLFEAGDAVPNALFRRGPDQRYTEVGMSAGVALDRHGNPMASMHGTIGDYDGDGLLDVFVPNLEHGCLYRNRGSFLFEEASERSGARAPAAAPPSATWTATATSTRS